ncbi:MAG TPA: hypothetical protein PLR76_12215 [Hyphomonas sp.]|nr:hypothetical protein [Hyphomonas sp.]
MILAILLEIISEQGMADAMERAHACKTTACICEVTPWRAGCPQVDMQAFPQDVIQCSRQPGLPWCQSACETGEWSWCAGMDRARAVELESFIRRRFIFETERTDDWDSQAEEILAGSMGRGDCDSYTSTVLQVLAMAGAPASQLGRALVRIGPVAGSDHQIGLAEFDGELWIIADSLAPPQPLNGSRYTIVWQQRLSDGFSFTLKDGTQ